MKSMWRSIMILSTLLLFCHCKNQTTQVKANDSQGLERRTAMGISAIDAKLPLRLDELDLSNRARSVTLGRDITSRIRQTVKSYADSIPIQVGDAFKDCYINTIRLRENQQTIFMVLLRHPHANYVNSRVLFYDNQKRVFADHAFDFNLWALYDFHEGRLIPANLKRSLKINAPEIESIDYNNDGTNDYKLTRLFHNGTFNAIHTTVLTVKAGRLDTLHFVDKTIGNHVMRP